MARNSIIRGFWLFVIVSICQTNLFAQYEPINPFVMPNDSTLNWYGSGDINNDHLIDWNDYLRLDSILEGSFSDVYDLRLKDRSDIDGDHFISDADKEILEDYLNEKINNLPGHWNMLKTRQERIEWLEKVLSIDQTEVGLGSAGYIGDYYSDQFIINTHGFTEEVLLLFQSPPIDIQFNGRFNLPVNSAGISYNRLDMKMARSMNAIMIGNNVFDWNDWCFIDPQWDQLIFSPKMDEPPSNAGFPPLNNWTDDIKNITQRDSILPLINLEPPEKILQLTSGYLDLEYELVDPNLKIAWYDLGGEKVRTILYKDSLYLAEEQDRLFPAYKTSGTINLLLGNGVYDLFITAEDHFSNRYQTKIQVEVMDPPPQINIISPVMDSVYTEGAPAFSWIIDDSDFSKAWHSIDSGDSKTIVPQEGNINLLQDNGTYQLILYAEDIFGNESWDTVRYSINRQDANIELDPDKDSWLITYPNPVDDLLNIVINNGLEGSSIQLSIQDMAGRVLWNNLYDGLLEGKSSLIVDFSKFTAGAYVLKASLNNKYIIARRILKN